MRLRFQVGFEFVDPAETAGFAGSGKKTFGSNGAPIARAVLSDVVHEDLVFFGHPWSFPYGRRRLRDFFTAAATAAVHSCSGMRIPRNGKVFFSVLFVE